MDRIELLMLSKLLKQLHQTQNLGMLDDDVESVIEVVDDVLRERVEDGEAKI